MALASQAAAVYQQLSTAEIYRRQLKAHIYGLFVFPAIMFKTSKDRQQQIISIAISSLTDKEKTKIREKSNIDIVTALTDGKPDINTVYRALPQWCKLLGEALDQLHWELTPLSTDEKCTEFCSRLIKPFQKAYQAGVDHHIEKITLDLPSATTLKNSLEERLSDELERLIIPSLADRLRQFRQQFPAFIRANLLPVESYLSQYIEVDNGWETYFCDSPVLVRFLCIKTLYRIRNDITLIGRLQHDRELIDDVFGIPQCEKIINIKTNCSDPHNHGKSVAILTFTNDYRLVYKPRSLICDLLYYELQDTIDTNAELVKLRIVNRGVYGWSEFAVRQNPSSKENIHLYYENMGRLMALLDFIGGGDFHEENFIPNDSKPIPIDLEGIFSFIEVNSIEDSLNNTPEEFKRHQLDATCMLPRYQVINRHSDIASIGPFTLNHKEYKLEAIFPSLIEQNTIAAKLEWIKQSQLNKEHVLVHQSTEIDPSDYVEDIAKGFASTYDTIIGLKEKFHTFLEEKSFENVYTRRLFRPTMDYYQISNKLLELESLGSWTKQRQVMNDLLSKGIDQLKDNQDRKNIIYSEIDQLGDLDIPIFSQNLTSGQFRMDRSTFALNVSNGVDFRPVYQFGKLINTRSRQYIDFAKLYFKKSVLCLKKDYELTDRLKRDGKTIANNTHLANCKDLCAMTLEVLVESTRFDPKSSIYSLNLVNVAGNSAVGMLSASPFYLEGMAGIIIFLKRCILAGIKINHRWLDSLLDKYIEVIKLFMAKKLIRNQGLYGIASAVYPLIYGFNSMVGKSPYARSRAMHDLNAAIEVTEEIKYFSTNNNFNDFLTGTCSNIILLTDLFLLTHDSRYYDMLASQIDIVLSTKTRSNLYGQFFDLDGKGQPMSGLAHGQSGVAYALAYFSYYLSRGSQFIDDIQLAVDFEYRHIDHANGKWLNYLDDRKQTNILGWCNGPAGIGLVRLFLDQKLNNKINLRNDIQFSIECLLRTSSANDTFCCGNMSVYLFLSKAAEIEHLEQLYTLNEIINNQTAATISRIYDEQVLNFNIGKSLFLSTGLLGGLPGVLTSLINIEQSRKSFDPFLLG